MVTQAGMQCAVALCSLPLLVGMTKSCCAQRDDTLCHRHKTDAWVHGPMLAS